MMDKAISNPLILELIDKGFGLSLQKDGFVLEGFYKSGTVRLEPKEDGTFTAHSRYNQQDEISSIDDLVYLNRQWWRYSKDRFEGWKKPEEKWAKEMVRLGILKTRIERLFITDKKSYQGEIIA